MGALARRRLKALSRPLAAGIAAVLLAGCGAAPAPVAPASPVTTPSVVITEADSGRSVQLAVGQEAAIRLSDRMVWSDPQASGGAVRVEPSSAAPGAGFREWTVTAIARGTARVSATGRPPCSPGQVCPALLQAFSVTVAVT